MLKFQITLRVMSILALVAILSACATSSVIMLGSSRAPISPDQVRIYTQPPPHYQEIALIHSTSQFSWAITDQQKIDKAISRMRRKAAALGANGLLLNGLNSRTTEVVGIDSSHARLSGNRFQGSSFGVAGGVMAEDGSGIAIYVEPAQTEQGRNGG